ncbi:hypothetical protein HBO01_04695 [Pseudomonas rhodesiae]|jgi:hypothetical protein|uniref:hypothetical protein n=1 Tax=Pseudomonas rhodesiae TaxID=76760 RepID=UPI00147298B4|nr:hypothetical protein [Pseudomonas rhodesiae]NMY77978.1 hypothetical protein [Pseudomonas rhodesiae]
MPTSLSKYLEIPNSTMESLGVFDPILDHDTRLFIDPLLLKHCKTPEFSSSYADLQTRFLAIGKLLQNSKHKHDPFWNSAATRMSWHEVRGLCIGYSTGGTAGSGIGKGLRDRILDTAKLIIDAGKSDPELFELVGLFEDNFGPDRISDMTANVIQEDIVNYSRNIYKKILPKDWDGPLDKRIGLPKNPFTKEPILLVPKELLRDLPSAFEWSASDEIGISSAEIRESLNSLVGNSWRSLANMKKEELKKLVLKYPDLIDDLVDQYSSKDVKPYDFDEDKKGEYTWYRRSVEAVSENPIALSLSAHPTLDEVFDLVMVICEKFKQLVENNGLNTLFYDSKAKVKNETAIQLAFYGIAEAYCEANKIMIARESNSGRGPVDFKFGSNNENSILVEIKKSDNSHIRNGIVRQLPEYMKSEKSRKAIYLILDLGMSQKQIDNMNEVHLAVTGSNISLVYIDGQLKPSASKL